MRIQQATGSAGCNELDGSGRPQRSQQTGQTGSMWTSTWGQRGTTWEPHFEEVQVAQTRQTHQTQRPVDVGRNAISLPFAAFVMRVSPHFLDHPFLPGEGGGRPRRPHLPSARWPEARRPKIRTGGPLWWSWGPNGPGWSGASGKGPRRVCAKGLKRRGVSTAFFGVCSCQNLERLPERLSCQRLTDSLCP